MKSDEIAQKGQYSNISARGVCSLLVLLTSIYLWVLIPITCLILVPFFGRRESSTIVIKLMSFGLLDVFFGEGLDSEIAISYYLWVISPLIIFSVPLLFMIWIRHRRDCIKQSVIYVVTIGTLAVMTLIRQEIETLSFLASCSAIFVGHLILKSRVRRGQTF